MQKLSAVADECCIYCHANEELFLRMLWYGLLRTFLGTTELLYLSASFTFPEIGTPRLVPFVRIFWWYQPAAFQPQICRACWQDLCAAVCPSHWAWSSTKGDAGWVGGVQNFLFFLSLPGNFSILQWWYLWVIFMVIWTVILAFVLFFAVSTLEKAV